MRYSSSSTVVILTAVAALVRALPPAHLESRNDDLDSNLFTLPKNDLDATMNIDGGLSDVDFSSSLLASNPDDSSAPLLFDDLSSSSLLPADDVIISDSLASSCVDPASKKRDLFDEDSLLLCKTLHPSQHRMKQQSKLSSHFVI